MFYYRDFSFFPKYGDKDDNEADDLNSPSGIYDYKVSYFHLYFPASLTINEGISIFSFKTELLFNPSNKNYCD
jgi:hypothetical protein